MAVFVDSRCHGEGMQLMTRLSPLQIVLFGVLLASLAINGLQGTRILRLQDALDAAKPGEKLAEGKALPPLDLRDAAGKHIIIDYGSVSKPTLLYVLSPSCVWCQRNGGSFRALSQHTNESLRIIGLSLAEEGIEIFRAKSGIDCPVYTPSPSTVRNYQLAATPTTMLISNTGTLLRQWSGAYTGMTKKSIEKYFSVELPAL